MSVPPQAFVNKNGSGDDCDAPPAAKRMKTEEEDDDLNDSNYDEFLGYCGSLFSKTTAHLIPCSSCPTTCTREELMLATDSAVKVAQFWTNNI